MPLDARDRGDIIARRRELVARMRLRGLSQREITAALPTLDQPCINEESGEPWSLATVNTDLKALQAEWRREAKKATEHHKARQMAELAEARRQAWLNNDMQSVLRAVGMEMGLLGTEAPKVTQVTGRDGNDLRIIIDYADTDPNAT